MDGIVNAIQAFDPDKVMDATKKALDAGIDPLKIIEQGITKGLAIVGERFGCGELFLMHLVAAAEASKAALKEIEPRIVKGKGERKTFGKVVIGTVAGDIHDIGKNIVAAMLFAGGFEVYDLGKDIPINQFIDKSKEVNANIIASSALLSTTMPVQREIVKALESSGLRNTVKVMVGGAPVTKDWAKEIGADSFAENAIEGVNQAKRLLDVK